MEVNYLTKSELRKARKVVVSANQKLVGELAIKKNAFASNRTLRRKASRLRKKAREEKV